MKIGVDASFLRKPGTGIGVVTTRVLRVLASLPEAENHQFVLYLDEDADTSYLPGERFKKRVFLPWWTRDDVPRRILWERQLPREVLSDGCEAFFSLSQSSTVFPKPRGIRHVMLVHDIIPFLFPAYQGKFTHRIHARRIESALPRADHLLAVSQTTKRDLSINIGIPEDRIDVAYPDCAPIFREEVTDDELDRVLRKHGLKAGYIYHGGGLEIRKNTEGLLRAYADLVNKRDDMPPLVISGKIHEKKNRLATDVHGLIRKLGIGERVKLLGFVPESDLPALYRGARCFVFPSRYEGFGLPVLEAMAIGTPVIAGRTAGAVPEIAGNSALLVDTETPSEIGGAIARLLDDPTVCENLIERGHERMKDFSWERFARIILSTIIQDTDV